MRNILAFMLITLLFSVTNTCYAQTKNIPLVEHIQTKKKGAFKYYQAEIKVGVGIEGKVFLNDSAIYEFTRSGGSVSINLSDGVIKKGVNTFSLEVAGINEKPETATLLSPANIVIKLYGMDEQGWPDEHSEIVKIEWLKTMRKAITFAFSLIEN